MNRRTTSTGWSNLFVGRMCPRTLPTLSEKIKIVNKRYPVFDLAQFLRFQEMLKQKIHLPFSSIIWIDMKAFKSNTEALNSAALPDSMSFEMNSLVMYFAELSVDEPLSSIEPSFWVNFLKLLFKNSRRLLFSWSLRDLVNDAANASKVFFLSK